MVEKVFWENPYQTELEAIVKAVDGAIITVDRTIFYAFSGGQESDRGTIGPFQVIDARKDGLEIFYTLDPGHTLQVGDRVTMTIDWDRRYRLMRLHFAAEVVLEIVCKKFPDVVKVGAHIAQEKARIDFEWNQNVSNILPQIQSEAEKIVTEGQEIESAFSDKAKERRYWKIKEFGEVPCGGTHIRRTSEIGAIRLKRVNPGKGRERIEIFVS